MPEQLCPYPRCPLRPISNVAANDNEPDHVNDNRCDFYHDVVRTAAKISLYMFGDESMRRRVYHLARTSNMPFHKQGSILCIRRSALDEFIQAQERRKS